MSRFLFGTAGWSYPDWEGAVYPRKKGRDFDRLTYLADYLDVVEINSSFYHPPPADMARGWLRKTSHRPEFFFVAKLWQKFTHQRDEVQESDHELFQRGLDPLLSSERWAGLLVQFPWSFDACEKHRGYALDLMYRYRDWRPFFEFRHASWLHPAVKKDLSAMRCGLVNLDQPLYERAYPLTAESMGETAYFRLHGRNRRNWFDPRVGRDGRYDYLYSESEIGELVRSMQQAAARARLVIVIGNNHFRGQALCNVLQLKAALVGVPVLAPLTARRHFAQLRSCSIAPEERKPLQPSLF